MARRVQIFKKATGQLIDQYAFTLDDSASDQDYLNKAWFIAVDDGKVIEANKIDYEIAFAEETSMQK